MARRTLFFINPRSPKTAAGWEVPNCGGAKTGRYYVCWAVRCVLGGTMRRLGGTMRAGRYHAVAGRYHACWAVPCGAPGGGAVTRKSRRISAVTWPEISAMAGFVGQAWWTRKWDGKANAHRDNVTPVIYIAPHRAGEGRWCSTRRRRPSSSSTRSQSRPTLPHAR